MDMLIGFLLGLVVMDFLWAWRLGLVHRLVWAVKQRLFRNSQNKILVDNLDD